MRQNNCQDTIIVKKLEDSYDEFGLENSSLLALSYEDRKAELSKDALIAEDEIRQLNDDAANNYITIEDSDDEMEIDIKQENLIKPDIKSAMAAEQLKNFKGVVRHLLKKHDITHHNKFIKHIELEPDVDDPNNYCRTCEKKHSTLAKYKFHLKQIHRIHIRTTINPRNKDIMPDADNPDFYCDSCEKKYYSEDRYRIHLRGYHSMKLKPRMNPEITPDWDDPDYYCKSCRRKYNVKYTYWKHLQEGHHMTSPEIRFPNPDNPNLHCDVCDIKYEDRVIYRDHCRKKHRMKLKPLQNLVCDRCNREYKGEHALMKHLRLEHKIIDDMCYARKRKPFNGITPDYDDPNFRCCACKKSFSTRLAYHYHLLAVHTISVPNPGDLEPILDDPNNYCRCCKRKYIHKYRYRQHLSMVHKIKLQPLRKSHRRRRKRGSHLFPESRVNQDDQEKQKIKKLQIGNKDINTNKVSQNANDRKQTTTIVRISDKDAFIKELTRNTDISRIDNETQTTEENQNGTENNDGNSIISRVTQNADISQVNEETQTSKDNQDGAEVEASSNEESTTETIDKDGNVDELVQNADMNEEPSKKNLDDAKVEAGSEKQIAIEMQIDKESV
ncbi:hypothetical protein INT46_005812 [Mucor plumbeus]|uniref:C2H2-type domain-containing protein n=1 Tax=Mucor plumbeus TaxID=97098 RepID=A0A8H7QNG4_9FUNG|nr:hypothetical protein INT46_005812 [Mucor plumbeus]